MTVNGDDDDGGVFKPILLRSSTPAANEKVLLYLESMERASASMSAAGSEAGGREHEPGPSDPPGPRYESFDSGPSFGNLGPLPVDNPVSPQQVPLPPSTLRSPTVASQHPNYRPTIPGQPSLPPASAYGGSINIDIHEPSNSPPPSSASARKSNRNRKESVLSDGKTVSAKSPSKLAKSASPPPPSSRAGGGTVYPPLPDSIMSPTSPVMSNIQSQGYGNGNGYGAGSTRSYPRAPPSRAYSLSPSDSPSQQPAKARRLEKEREQREMEQREREKAKSASPEPPARVRSPGASVVSGGGVASGAGRPFSPYRHGPTTEDLLAAAAASAVPPPPPSKGGGPGSRLSKVQEQEAEEGAMDDGLTTPTPSRPTSPRQSVLRTGTPQKDRDGSRVQAPMSPSAEFEPGEEELVHSTLSRYRQPPGASSAVSGHGHGHGHHHPRGPGSHAHTHTSYAPSSLDADPPPSHFHDRELCVLLHELEDPYAHEVVKKAVRKAVRQRVKRLGMSAALIGAGGDADMHEYRRSFHDHHPDVHLGTGHYPAGGGGPDADAPLWARQLMQGMARVTNQIDALTPTIERLNSTSQSRSKSSRLTQPTYQGTYGEGDDDDGEGRSGIGAGEGEADSRFVGTFQSSELDRYAQTQQTRTETQTPLTQTVNINTHPTGTMYEPGDSVILEEGGLPSRERVGPADLDTFGDEEAEGAEEELGLERDGLGSSAMQARGPMSDWTDDGALGRDDSPGGPHLEAELYKLRVRPTGGGAGTSRSSNAPSHRTWEVARDGAPDDERYPDDAGDGAGHHVLPDGDPGDGRSESPPLPPIPAQLSRSSRQDLVPSEVGGGLQPQQGAPTGQQVWSGYGTGDAQGMPPWQRIHQMLLDWAKIWPLSELDGALASTTRGHQVDEVALSIWATQTYKRHVRSKMTDGPPGRVDRMFVPPNYADAISTAVFHGRHQDASRMLQDLWAPFGLEGMPRLLIVLAKHRTDDNHWVVHRFSLPDGALTTYDSFPERTLPDGRPLGWWFAIRLAWPNGFYPPPDHLMQKMVRLHRPMQLPIDNSVAAAGIWRNLLMGSRAERSLDLERLRDLVNTEVRNLRQRKMQGKLSIGGPRPNWEDMS